MWVGRSHIGTTSLSTKSYEYSWFSSPVESTSLYRWSRHLFLLFPKWEPLMTNTSNTGIPLNFEHLHLGYGSESKIVIKHPHVLTKKHTRLSKHAVYHDYPKVYLKYISFSRIRVPPIQSSSFFPIQMTNLCVAFHPENLMFQIKLGYTVIHRLYYIYSHPQIDGKVNPY